jgi:signal transduction histidine kinase
MRTTEAGRPRQDDVLSLAERTWALAGLRGVSYAAVLATLVVRPGLFVASTSAVLRMTIASALVTLATLFVGRLSRRRAMALVAASLLVDGAYLGWATYMTGGSTSPLWLLVDIHVVAVTLLTSFETGVKLAIWHSLVRVTILYAEASRIVSVVDPPGVVPSATRSLPFGGLASIAIMWALFAVTAVTASVNEHELRAHRFRLEALAGMVRRFEAAASTDDISAVLLDTVRQVFGLRRAVVMAERDGCLAILAERDVEDGAAVPERPDDVVERAWHRRESTLVRRLDPDRDARLASLMPDAVNLVVVPLFARGRSRAGVVVLERAGRVSGLRRSTVAMIDQFCAHAWLAMNNAWLLDELRDAVEENRALQDQLLEHNRSLEETVAERTAEVTERLHQLRQVDDARRALLEKLVTAQEEERSRLAGDIHDDPIQKMVVTSMRLQMLRRQVNDPDLTETLEQLLDTVRTSIASLRHLIFELRPSVLDEDGLAPALRALLDSLGAEFAYDIANEILDEPPSETRVILYRIAQEAIGNVRKHARADHVEVELGERRGGFWVRISDDGVGFGAPDVAMSAPGHLGLTSMRERAELAGGSCSVQSLPGNGTVVEAWLPGPEVPTIASAQAAADDRLEAALRTA